jgi:microcystin-dependent protein
MNNWIIMALMLILIIIFILQNNTSENFTDLSNEAVQNLSSVYNASSIVITNLTANGSVNFLPKGIIVAWSGQIIPAGWILCDGANSTPDLRDKFILGAGTTYLPNSSGGEIAHTLTNNEIPSHRHQTIDDYFNYATNDNYFGDGSKSLSGGGGWMWGTGGNKFYTSYTGGDKPHNNMPPYFTLAYIMRNI